MRKKLLAIAMTLLLLGGCGKKTDATMQRALDFRSALLGAGGCTFSADFTADYEDEIFQFSAQCVCDGAGVTLTVTAPETLCGIRAEVKGDDARVLFDDTQIALSLLSERLAPMSAPFRFYGAWTEDYVQYTGAEGELLRMTAAQGYDKEELSVDTWLDSENIPLRAEIAAEGRTLLFAEITDFRFGTEAPSR